MSGCSRPRTRRWTAACAASTSAAASASRAATSSPRARRSTASRAIAGRGASAKATSCPRWCAASPTPTALLRIGQLSAELTRAGMQWTNKKSPKDIVKAGDLIDVEITKIDGSDADRHARTDADPRRRAGRDRQPHRRGAGDGRRLQLRAQQVQSRHAGVPPDGLDGEADPLHRGDRSRPHADDDPDRRADDLRRRRRPAAVRAAQLRSQVHGPADAAPRARAVAQHPVGEGDRHARPDAGRGVCEEVRLRAGLPAVPVDGARRAGSDADRDHQRLLGVPEPRHSHGAVPGRVDQRSRRLAARGAPAAAEGRHSRRHRLRA